jgi:2-iminobutanoate/2-iminopropanoate deaminase
VVSVDVFLDDLDNYSEFNNIYIDYFTQDFPARMVLEAARIPLNAKIEIKVIAAK